MKKLAVFLLIILPVVAQEPGDARNPLEKARELERKAGKLLDQGQRGQAFELLAQAAKLRDIARAETTKAKAKTKKKKQGQKPRARKAANNALAAMDASLMNNDLKKTRRHAEEARKALGRWARELAAREKRLMGKSAPKEPLLKRVESLEKQLAELRRMLRNSR